MTQTTLLTVLIATTFVIALTPQILAQETNSDVSIWKSPGDGGPTTSLPDGIFPIGGSGQIAGNFAVDTYDKKDTAIQIGLRAQERFVGPIDPIGNVYLAPIGESPAGFPLWNFDFSIDSGTSYLGEQLGKDLTALDLEDFTVVLDISDSEGNTYALDFDLDDTNANPFGPIILSQNSWNLGFGFITIPVDSDSYDITLTVSNDKGKTLSESEITVVVTDQVPEDGKIDICHKGKKTINVSVNAITAHLNHGDSIGPCD